MKLQLPKVIAHRGAPKSAPENTLASLTAASQQGATFTEFDVMLSKDDVPVVIHDETLERTTNGHGEVIAHTYQQLNQLDAGSWFNPKFHHEKIPTLTEYLQTAAHLNLGVNIELKASEHKEAILAKLVLATLQQHWQHSTPLISSFSITNLKAIHNANCPYPLGLNVDDWKDTYLQTAKSLNCYSIHLDKKDATKKLITIIKQHGFKVLVFTVNDPQLAQQLFSWGVTSIFSDFPTPGVAK